MTKMRLWKPDRHNRCERKTAHVFTSQRSKCTGRTDSTSMIEYRTLRKYWILTMSSSRLSSQRGRWKVGRSERIPFWGYRWSSHGKPLNTSRLSVTSLEYDPCTAEKLRMRESNCRTKHKELIQIRYECRGCVTLHCRFQYSRSES